MMRAHRSLLILLSSVTALTTTLAAGASAATGTPAVTGQGPGTISTLAGNGQTIGDPGDGGPATNAPLDTPSGVARDTVGNTYVTDYGNSRVHKVTPQGVITTVAGTGDYGHTGDGGPATAAHLKTPYGVAVDGQGDLYIADYFDSRVRKVDPQGVITTVAGTGDYGYSGDGGPAISAGLNLPTGIAVDKTGNLYIADTNNNRIRKVSADQTITTALGTGTPGNAVDQVGHPRGVAADSTGAVIVADTDNNRVQKRDAAGKVTTISGTGGAGNQLSGPRGVAVDGGDNVYVADTGNNRALAITAAGSKTRPMAGAGGAGFSGDGGQATVAQLSAPSAIALDGTASLYVADRDNNRVRRVIGGPLITAAVGTGVDGSSGDGGPATNAALISPDALAMDAKGNLYIVDGGPPNIRKVSAAGIITTIARGGTGDMTSAHGVAVDRLGSVYFADTTDSVVRKIDTQGKITVVAGTAESPGFSGDGGPAAAAQLGKHVPGVAVDAAGNLYIGDPSNFRIRKVDTNGIISTFAGTGGKEFAGDGGPATSAGVSGGNVSVDGSGNVYIVDASYRRIRKVGTDGIITTVAGTGNIPDSSAPPIQPDGVPATSITFGSVNDIATDAAGNFYFHDVNRIRKVGPDGILRTVGGAGRNHGESDNLIPSGDGGPAALAEFAMPQGMVVDVAGNVYVADSFSHRVRKVAVS